MKANGILKGRKEIKNESIVPAIGNNLYNYFIASDTATVSQSTLIAVF